MGNQAILTDSPHPTKKSVGQGDSLLAGEFLVFYSLITPQLSQLHSRSSLFDLNSPNFRVPQSIWCDFPVGKEILVLCWFLGPALKKLRCFRNIGTLDRGTVPLGGGAWNLCGEGVRCRSIRGLGSNYCCFWTTIWKSSTSVLGPHLVLSHHLVPTIGRWWLERPRRCQPLPQMMNSFCWCYLGFQTHRPSLGDALRQPQTQKVPYF